MMMALFKAIWIAIILAIILPFSMVYAGFDTKGVLAVHYLALGAYGFYWSWPIFFVVAGIFWTIFKFTE